jgi:hypothetical protein
LKLVNAKEFFFPIINNSLSRAAAAKKTAYLDLLQQQEFIRIIL